MTGFGLIEDVPADRPALADDAHGDWLSYGDLAALVRLWAGRVEGPRALAVIYPRNDTVSVAAILGALSAGHAVALFDPNLPAPARARLGAAYRPGWTIEPTLDSVVGSPDRVTLHQDLAVLLSTSGSTGSAKLVRLSGPAMLANASAIAEVLDIGADDVAAGHLPLHYSYGLSVLTSHLARGARIRLTGMGLTDKAFWPAIREAHVTHMPGVPFHYQVMLKLGLQRLRLPSLRTLTQAGGSLELELRWQAYRFMQESGGHFCVMYGQTEAAPRMTTLAHADFPAASGSVGTALPDCRIEIHDPDAGGCGEVVFHGPNVMLGYAESHADLARGDDLSGCLHTGDIGVLDDDGRLTLRGRIGRIRKLFGLRINLDEVEAAAADFGHSAVTLASDMLTIHTVSTGDAEADDELRATMRAGLRQRFTLPVNSYDVRFVATLPRNERGKVDYTALQEDR